MSNPRKSDPEHHASHLVTAIAGRLTGLREWWRRRDQLGELDHQELERIARDVHMTAHDLESLAALGPDAADLLHERMRALDISRDDVETVARGLMQDLERTCSFCTGKDVCATDLAKRPDDLAWKGYCANATALESVKKIKGRLARG
jgi:hypothetical protein